VQNHDEPPPPNLKAQLPNGEISPEVPPFLMTLDSAAGGREEEEIGGVKAGIRGASTFSMSWQSYDDSDSCDI